MAAGRDDLAARGVENRKQLPAARKTATVPASGLPPPSRYNCGSGQDLVRQCREFDVPTPYRAADRLVVRAPGLHAGRRTRSFRDGRIHLPDRQSVQSGRQFAALQEVAGNPVANARDGFIVERLSLARRYPGAFDAAICDGERATVGEQQRLMRADAMRRELTDALERRPRIVDADHACGIVEIVLRSIEQRAVRRKHAVAEEVPAGHAVERLRFGVAGWVEDDGEGARLAREEQDRPETESKASLAAIGQVDSVQDRRQPTGSPRHRPSRRGKRAKRRRRTKWRHGPRRKRRQEGTPAAPKSRGGRAVGLLRDHASPRSDEKRPGAEFGGTGRAENLRRWIHDAE